MTLLPPAFRCSLNFLLTLRMVSTNSSFVEQTSWCIDLFPSNRRWCHVVWTLSRGCSKSHVKLFLYWTNFLTHRLVLVKQTMMPRFMNVEIFLHWMNLLTRGLGVHKYSSWLMAGIIPSPSHFLRSIHFTGSHLWSSALCSATNVGHQAVPS